MTWHYRLANGAFKNAPSGPSSCCQGYRLLSDSNAQIATFTMSDAHLRFSSFEATVQFNGSQSDINNIWGWINAYSEGLLISSELFGGHYWSQAFERQTIEAIIPSSADIIEIIPRTNLGYTAFSYALFSVPEPSGAALFACGLVMLGLSRRTRLSSK